jgi:hypothetical protein
MRIVNMLSVLLVAWLGLWPGAHADAIPGYTYSRAPGSFNSVTYPATVAFKFLANEAIDVTALGIVDSGPPGLLGAHDVGLWNQSGVLLASTKVPGGESSVLSNGFRFAPIDPVQLTIGHVYFVGAVFDLTNNFDAFVEAPLFTTPQQVTLLDPGWTYSAEGQTLAFPGNFRSGPDAAAANFLFSSPVPDISRSTSLFVGLIPLALWFGRARAKSK